MERGAAARWLAEIWQRVMELCVKQAELMAKSAALMEIAAAAGTGPVILLTLNVFLITELLPLSLALPPPLSLCVPPCASRADAKAEASARDASAHAALLDNNLAAI